MPVTTIDPATATTKDDTAAALVFEVASVRPVPNAVDPAPTVHRGANTVPAVNCIGLNKRYRGRQVLADIGFELPQGNSLAVVGLNGAGKTTLLRALLDFIRPDTGRIELFGLPSTRADSRRQIAFLPERFVPSPDLSGWQSLQMVLGLRQIRADRARCSDDLARLGFDLTMLDAPTRTYSKGMLQKIGLTGALQADCALTVLDEPMSGLDPITRRTLARVLNDVRGLGGGLLFTAHTLHDLDTLCDLIAIVHGGRLAFFGSPEEMRSRFDDRDLEQAFLNCIEREQDGEPARARNSEVPA